MPLNIKDGNLIDRTLKTTTDGSDLVPHHRVDNLPPGASTEATLLALLAKVIASPSTEAKQDTTITQLANLLTELQLKADLSENQPTLIRGKSTDYSPYYNGPKTNVKTEGTFDPDGQLNVRGPVLTDEGSTRVNFANSSLAVSLGAVTVSGLIVTGSGFLSLVVDRGDYFKLAADGENRLVQIQSIDSDTQLTLASNYAGATSGTGERWIMQTVTGSGSTITVSSGQATIAAGTTANAISEIKRLIDYSPVNVLCSFSASQRIANQEIFIGFRDPSAVIKYFQWIRLTGTTNTVVDLQSGYNPTGSPSASETQTITSVTLPNSLNTASLIQFRLEVSFDRVRYYAKAGLSTDGTQEILLGEIVRVAPHANDPLEFVVRVVNGATPPASNTNVVLDFLYAKNFNKLQVEQSGNQEGFISIPLPGQMINGSASANNTDVMVIDCSQIREIWLTSSGTWILTVTFQSSNDPTFATAIASSAYRSDNAQSFTHSGGSNTTSFKIPVYAKYMRFRVTAYTSGTINLQAYCVGQSTLPTALTSVQGGVWTVQPGNTANTTAWLVNDIPNTAQGHSTYHAALNTAASSMPTSVKTTAGVIGSIEVSNNNATTAFYFKLFNKASAPTMGSDIPVKNFRIGPGQTVLVTINKNIRLPLGIAYAVTSGPALLNTGTITTAEDIMVNISYT